MDIVSSLVYLVDRVDSSRGDRVHCARMIKYTEALDWAKVPEDVLQLVSRTESRYEVPVKLVSIAKRDEKLWLCLQWDGIFDERDWTWSSLEGSFEDVLKTVTKLLKKNRGTDLAHQAVAKLGIFI